MFSNLQNDITLTTNGFGYIYDTEILQDFSTKHLKHYYYMLHDKLATPHCHQKPEGDYLTLYFQGVYMFNNKISANAGRILQGASAYADFTTLCNIVV